MSNKDSTPYFSKNYEQARQLFAQEAQNHRQISQHRYIHPHNNALSTDVIRDGAEDARAVLIVTSGLHGVEGYAGSAVQSYSLAENLLPTKSELAIVYVHALNPYGFAHDRRVNEDNIDLNRNFIDWTEPRPAQHPLTTELHSMLLPKRWSWPNMDVMGLAEKHGIQTLQEAITQGQYNFSDGLFYGGAEAAWSNMVWQQILERHASNADYVAHVDIHTGLGPYGHGELVISAPSRDPIAQRSRNWWGNDITSTADGNSVSAKLSGDILTAFNAVARTTEETRIALEFGTLPAMDVLEALAYDNWVHTKRWPNAKSLEEASRKMRAAFAPDDPAWQGKVIERSAEVLVQARDGLLRSLKR